MGMRGAGITGMMGISPNAAAIGAANSQRLMDWAHLSNIQQTHGATTTSSSVAMHADNVNIVTQSTDPDGMARAAVPALRRRLSNWAANASPS